MTTSSAGASDRVPARRRPSRPWRIARNVALGVLATLFAVWLVLFVTKGRFLKHPVERIAAKATGRQVRVAGDFQLYFAPFNVKFLAEGLTVSNPAWATRRNLFESSHVDTRISTWRLVFGRKRINWLELVNGAVDLEWNRAGKNTWTFSDEPSSGKPLDLPTVKRAAVSGTRLRYVDPRMNIRVDLGFDTIRAAETRLTDAVRFSGRGEARDQPFTVAGALLSPNETAAGGANRLTARIDAARTRIDVAGTLPGAFELEGSRLKVRACGRNIADLFSVMGVAVPDTRAYHLAADFTKAGVEYRFTYLTGMFGDSDVAGTLTVANVEPRIKLTATLHTRSIDIVDVAPFIGYNPDDVVRGAVAAAGPPGSGPPRLLPDSPLRVDALKNFDADVRYTAGVVKSRNVPVSNIDLTLSLVDRLLTLSPLTFDLTRGHLSSDVVIDARPKLVHTTYDIRLSPTPMAKLLAGFGVAEAGTTGTIRARVRMEGDGDSVRRSLATSRGRIAVVLPRGTLWARNVQLAEIDIGTFVQKMFQKKLKEPVEINCGLIGFTVRNGVAAADPILIDTQKNVILGRGGFSFKTEGMDLAFRADGKKFSLFSGQSPVGLGGYFAQPAIKVVSPDLLARAGVGLGLAVAATPVGALLAFVDVGDAKDTACGPVLAGATAAAQRTTGGKPRDDVGNGSTGKSESGKRSDGERHEQRKKFLGIF